MILLPSPPGSGGEGIKTNSPGSCSFQGSTQKTCDGFAGNGIIRLARRKGKVKMIKVSARKIRATYPVASAGYCALQNALSRISPAYSTAGVHGWNADVYLLPTHGHGTIALATGYRPFGAAIPPELQDQINSTVFSTVEDLGDAIYRAAFPGK